MASAYARPHGDEATRQADSHTRAPVLVPTPFGGERCILD
jgi:hypothetical protein